MNDKRYKIGIRITAGYLLVLAIYAIVQRGPMLDMEPNEFGDFLAGVASPLAFLWLVLGYLQQGEELTQNTLALRLQVQELRESVEQQRALVEATNRQHAFDLSRTEKERRASFHAAQPLFEAYANWEKESPEAVIFKFTLKNVGERSTQVSVTCEGENEQVVLTGDTVVAFEHGAQRRWRVRIPKDTSPLDQRIVIHYTDANGERQTQKVTLKFFMGGDSESKLQAFVQGTPEQIYPWDSQSSPSAIS